MNTEKVLMSCEPGYKKLEAVAKMLSAFSPKGIKYVVEDVWLDYGAELMWTTICSKGADIDWQVLYPVEWDEIMAADTPIELVKVVDEIRSGKYFPDK